MKGSSEEFWNKRHPELERELKTLEDFEALNNLFNEPLISESHLIIGSEQYKEKMNKIGSEVVMKWPGKREDNQVAAQTVENKPVVKPWLLKKQPLQSLSQTAPAQEQPQKPWLLKNQDQVFESNPVTSSLVPI